MASMNGVRNGRLTVSVICIVVGFIVQGCFVFDPHEIDPELMPYLEHFKQEAAERGHRFNYARLRLVFDDGLDVQGHTNRATRTIKINPRSDGYRMNPEALVFHELGHLYLDRDHVVTLINKRAVSIMNSNADPVYHTVSGGSLHFRREYYVNELFDSNTAVPRWMYER